MLRCFICCNLMLNEIQMKNSMLEIQIKIFQRWKFKWKSFKFKFNVRKLHKNYQIELNDDAWQHQHEAHQLYQNELRVNLRCCKEPAAINVGINFIFEFFDENWAKTRFDFQTKVQPVNFFLTYFLIDTWNWMMSQSSSLLLWSLFSSWFNWSNLPTECRNRS